MLKNERDGKSTGARYLYITRAKQWAKLKKCEKKIEIYQKFWL